MAIAKPSEPAAVAGENGRFWIVLAVACVLLGVMALPALQGRMYQSDDLGAYFLPLKYFYADALAQGTASDWCPNLFGGFYLQGEGQVGMYHPFVRFVYGWLPFTTAYNIEFLIRYPMLLLGMYLLLRRWQLPCDAALLGALTFAFSGFNLLHHVHLNAVEIVAHIPFLLLAVDYLLCGGAARQRIWAWLCLALLTASAVLFAYPQYVMFAGLTELVYIAALRGGLTPFRGLLAFGSAKVLGVLMGCVQLVPTWEALSLSVRNAPSAEFQTSYSLHPANLVQLASPYFFAKGFVGDSGGLHEFGLFNGVLATVLVAWVLLRRSRLGAHWPLARGVLLAGGVALVLALGKFGWLYDLQTRVPLLNVFRAPCRYIVLVHFAMAILAAVAAADLLRPANQAPADERREPRGLWLLVLFVGIVSCGGMAFYVSGFGKLGRVVGGPLAHGGAIVMTTAAVALVAALARGWRGAFTSLVLLAAVSQGWYGLCYFWVKMPATLAELRAAAPQPPEQGSRVALADNRVVFNDVRSASGYAPLRHRRVFNYLQPAPRLMAGVAIADTPPLPYVRLVERTLTTANPAAALAGIDFHATALVDRELALPPGPVGAVEVVREQPGRLAFRTTTEVPRLLAVSESMHPGWEVRLDGQVEPPVRVNGDWLGCVVPAGAHEVEFSFQPWSLRWGERLSVLGMILTLGGFGIALLRTTRPLPGWSSAHSAALADAMVTHRRSESDAVKSAV